MQLTKFALVLIVTDTQLQLHSPRLRSPNARPKSLKRREGESPGCILWAQMSPQVLLYRGPLWLMTRRIRRHLHLEIRDLAPSARNTALGSSLAYDDSSRSIVGSQHTLRYQLVSSQSTFWLARNFNKYDFEWNDSMRILLWRIPPQCDTRSIFRNMYCAAALPAGPHRWLHNGGRDILLQSGITTLIFRAQAASIGTR